MLDAQVPLLHIWRAEVWINGLTKIASGETTQVCQIPGKCTGYGNQGSADGGGDEALMVVSRL